MTPHELLLLASGFSLGAYVMLAVHIAGSVLKDPKMRRVT